MNYSNCPLCGQPIFRQDFHRCRGIGAIPAESFTLSAPDRQWITPDGLQYCPACGAPMLQPDHTCRKVKPEPPTEAAMKQAMLVDKDTLKFDHVKRLALLMIEHEQMCEKCLFFAERGSKVRCAEYLNMNKVCSKWQKRVGIKI
jgi:predicted RNA-binding Zn-ribbon protein involved in translation (DUF1610 family)